MTLQALRFLPLPLLLCLSACTGDGDGLPDALPASADVLLTDAPVEDLLFLRAELESVVLEHEDGSLTSNLLGGPLQVDLLSLSGVFQWVLSSNITAGTLTAVRLSFDPAQFEAADKDGTPVTITPLSSLLRAEFELPYTVEAEGYTRIEVDFDLLSSLDGLVSSGTLTLDPVGSGIPSGGGTPLPLDEIKGVVTAADALLGTLTLSAFADGDLAVPLGEVAVQVVPGALLLDEDGSVFASETAVYAALIPGSTLVEAHGSLDDGLVVATKIEVEDVFGLGGPVAAELRGKVVGHTPGVSLELLIEEIKQGSSIVSPVLSVLGDPASITVGITAGTFFFLDEEDPVTEAALAVGQTVEVKFSTFATEPFPAFKVEIEDANPTFQGSITDVAGLPVSFEMHLQDGDPALLAGLVSSTSTDVSVSIGVASLSLKVEGSSALAATDLSVGLRTELSGILAGSPSTPVIGATVIEVLPGRLDGALVASVNPAESLFTTTGGEILDPFGGGITAGPLDVLIEPNCVFTGDADSVGAFFALTGFVTVRVEGIASGNPNEIRAFTVQSVVGN
jgi:hypothetical protein